MTSCGQVWIFFGHYGIFIVVALSIVNAIISTKREVKSLIALGLSLVVSYAISSLVYVERPFIKWEYEPLIPHAPDSSFPSHNASVGFALSFSTLNTSKILGILSLCFSALMSAGRIYAGLHSWFDITAGGLIGFFCALFAYSKFSDKIIVKLKHKIQNHRQKKAAH